MDSTRRLGSLSLENAPGRLLSDDARVLERIRDRALAALAVEAVGVADRALQLAVEHAKLDFQRAEREAWAAFEQRRAPVVEAYSAKAAERLLAEKLEEVKEAA